MRALIIDTALEACSVALAGGGVDVDDEALIGKGHAEYLIPQIERLMARAGTGFAGLDRIICGIGPGSFTGIRAGLAAARGLAIALKIPVVGVTTLEALALHGRSLRPGPVMAVIDARRGEVYAQGFAADGAPLAEPAALTLAEAASLARTYGAGLVGSGGPLLQALDPSLVLIEPTAFAPIRAIAEIGLARVPAALPPGPLYIRAADAKPQAAYALARQMREAHP